MSAATEGIGSEGTRIPSLGGGLPLLGHALAFRRNPVDLLARGRAELGDMFRFRLFGKQVYALLSPPGIEAFFKTSDDQLGQRDAYRFTVPIFGRGVAYDVAPELMAEQMRLVHPALRDDAMQGYAALMQSEVERFAEQLGDSGEIDLLARMNELTVMIVGNCLIGAEFRARLSAEFASLYHDLEGGLNLIAFIAPNAPTPANRRRDRARRRVGELISSLIADRRARSRGVQDEAHDFLTVLMQARYQNGDSLSDEAIAGLIVTLLFAGQHSTAAMATWLGLLLMHHPGILGQVRDEATSVAGNGPVTLGAMKRLTFMDAVLKEAERLFPPLVILIRTVLRGLDVAGIHIPAGALAMVSPAVSHRSSAIFEMPDRFDPARFLPPREEDRRVPLALFGFGGGRHRCLGMAFAHLQIKVIWTVLLQRFDFALAQPDIFPAPDYSTWLVGPSSPLVRYRRRALIDVERAAAPKAMAI